MTKISGKKSVVSSVTHFNDYTNKVAEDLKWQGVHEKKESKKHAIWNSEMDFFFSVLGYAGENILIEFNSKSIIK